MGICLLHPLIYTPNLHYKHRVGMKRAHHMGYTLLNGIKNDFILKFSLSSIIITNIEFGRFTIGKCIVTETRRKKYGPEISKIKIFHLG